MPPARTDHLLNVLALIETELDSPVPSRANIRALLEIARYWVKTAEGLTLRTDLPPVLERAPDVGTYTPPKRDRTALKEAVEARMRELEQAPLDTSRDPK